MSLIEWDDSYSVKIREIDGQHMRLLEIINDLYEAMRAGKANDVLAGLFGDLVDYTQTHFATEEGYLERYGYPDVRMHQLQHDVFIDKILALRKDFESGRADVSTEIMTFLQDWLFRHIKGTDMKYVPFLTGKGMR